VAKTYCIDTSALIAAWYERYKPNRFPKLWEQLDQLIQEGLCVPKPKPGRSDDEVRRGWRVI
jgi:hypothetical protein